MMARKVLLFFGLTLLATSICGAEDAHVVAPVVPTGVTVEPVNVGVDSCEFATPPLTDVGWIVRLDGVGPTKIGMSLQQLNVALGEKFAMPSDKEDQACFYVASTKHPQVSFMIENGRLVRFDVDKSGVATKDGVQVGDSEEQVKQIYGSRLKIEPHHYTDGHYLTVQDGDYGVRFETDGGKVSTLYAGRLRAIQYVEGCQ